MSEQNLSGISSEEKRKLLLRALQKKAGVPEGTYPLSLLQEGMLFLSRLQPESPQYHMPYLLRLRGKLDAAALERSLNELRRRHVSLRAAFITDAEGRPAQQIAPFQLVPLPLNDLSGLPETEREAAARQLNEADEVRPFDLAAGNPVRFRLIRLRADEHWLCIVVHHLVFDLVSLGVFLEELSALYRAFVAGQPAPLEEIVFSYIHLARNRRQWPGEGVLATQLDYWREQLGGELPVLDLATDHARPAVSSGRGASLTQPLPDGLLARLTALGRAEGATLFMTLLTATSVLLHRYTQQDDILIGTPAALRDRPETERLIGLLINTLVVRTDLSGQPSFREMLRRVRDTALNAYSHPDLPFLKLVEAIQPARTPGRSPIFQVMFALEQSGPDLDLPGLQADLLEGNSGSAKFDLTLLMRADQHGLSAVIEYSTDLFEESTIRRMAGHLGRLLESAVAQPDAPVATLAMLNSQERDEITRGWNSTAQAVPQERLIHDMVRERALAEPGRIAAVHGAAQLTYAELEERAAQLAGYLRTQGVGPDVLVGVCMERSLDLVVAELAVLRAGGAYVPMDPAYPAERLAFLARDTQAALILTQHRLLARLPAEQMRCLALDADWAMIAQAQPAPAHSPAGPQNLAYVIYTSGSTGTPKGVAISHANLLNLVFWHRRIYALTPDDRCTQLAGPGFDASVWEIWPVLATGARLYVVDDSTRLAPRALRDWMIANGITVSFAPTPLAEELIGLEWPAAAPLRFLLTGGDKLHHHPPAGLPFTLVNHYGPTECTVLATAVAVPPRIGQDQAPTIGRPVDNTSVYVLDRLGQPLPVGIPGELVIGGAGVARGYWNRPELTAERFIPDPFSTTDDRRPTTDDRQTETSSSAHPLTRSPAQDGGQWSVVGGRLYRTGDRVRWLPDGTIEFMGRIDTQIKLRGFRVEPAEIESALLQHPAVREAVVVVRAERAGDARLVAYLTPTTDQRRPTTDPSDTVTRRQGDKVIEVAQEITLSPLHPVTLSGPQVVGGQSSVVGELRAFLAQRLPEYMVPSAYVMLDELPLMPSGKVDRRALPAPPAPTPRQVEPLPGAGAAQTIAQIWRAVLGREDVGLHDNFFDLGGHSLLLVQVHERLRAAFPTDIALIDLFTYPTVSALAQRIDPQPATEPATPASQPAAQPAPVALEDSHAVAIIGMAGRFPGAADVESFWQNLRDGVESISRFERDELLAAGAAPGELDHPQFVPAKGVVADADLFDAAFFGVSPREAETLDPQQRVFLECAWETLEHAGYDPERYAGRIGVYAGSSFNTYLLNNVYPNAQHVQAVGMYQVFVSSALDFLTNRTAYKLNLRGPAVTIQTACSTSLVAIHTASRALRAGECEMALAGGVSIPAPLKEGYIYREGEIMSPDGHCRTFDAQAAGTVSGSGVALVLLKRLDAALRDGDTIYAVVRGTAINNDGSGKIGYTAPSVEGQAEVITAALDDAGIHPDTISYVEAHGTGTVLGDPIEIQGLTRAFRARGSTGRGVCAIGSVKPNIGHLDAAAGVTGVIKTSLALQHGQIPPSLNFSRPNPRVDFAASPFYVNAALADWQALDGPRRAGVSSFGVGGTNAHVVLEQAPTLEPTDPARPWQTLLLSARTPAALERAVARLRTHLERNPDANLADVAYTLQNGRRAFSQRWALVCRDAGEALQALEAGAAHALSGQATEGRGVAFLFPGQGAQYPGMAHELYQDEPIFRDWIDRCATLLEPHLGLDIRSVIFPDDRRPTTDDRRPESTHPLTRSPAHPLTVDGGQWSVVGGRELDQTQYTQPALFVVEYALAQLWLAWSVRPQALIGHSIGEYVAACLAEVLTLEDALRLVAIRGRLVQGCPTGAMLSIGLTEPQAHDLLPDDVTVAAVNSPAATVVAGPEGSIAALEQQLAGQGVNCRRLHTSHAFHSAMLDPILEPFLEELRQVRLAPPRIPFLSNLTGDWISAEQATDPYYWAQHLRQPVRFADGLRRLLADERLALLEVGPGTTLSTLARQQPERGETHVIVASRRHPRERQPDRAALLTALSRLWLSGLPVDWARVWSGERRRRIALPTYPFERQRYWLEAPRAVAPVVPATTPLNGNHVPPTVLLNGSAEHSTTLVEPSVPAETMLEGEIEQMVGEVWQEVLGVSKLRGQDNFFELGGDSLMAARVINRLRDLLLFDVPMNSMFETGSLSELARLIEQTLEEQLAEFEHSNSDDQY